MPAFSLRDQHDQPHEISFPREKAILLIAVDRKGAEHIATWIKPLGPFGSNAVTLAVVGDVSPIPPFLRARYQKNFQKTLPCPVLLDWSGDVVKKLILTKHVPNLFVANPQGEIVFQTAGLGDDAKIKAISAVIDQLTAKK